MKKQILDTLEKHFQSQINRHRMNIEIMLENPRAIHEHTDIMAAIEKEIAHMSEYEDKLNILANYFTNEGEFDYDDR